MAVQITSQNGVKVEVGRTDLTRDGFVIKGGLKTMKITDLNGHYVDVDLSDDDRDTLVFLLEQ